MSQTLMMMRMRRVLVTMCLLGVCSLLLYVTRQLYESGPGRTLTIQRSLSRVHGNAGWTSDGRSHNKQPDDHRCSIKGNTTDLSATFIFPFTFVLNPYLACQRNETVPSRSWNMVIVVISKIDYFERRDAIRNTWGSSLEDLNMTLVFLVGCGGKGSDQYQLNKEASLFGDIIQVEVEDLYDYLTLKSVAMLQWLHDYCSNSLLYLKTDDDTFINTAALSERLTDVRGSSRVFLCHVFYNARPDRRPASKWHVTNKEFPGRVFPTYCSGTAYVFHSSLLSDLYRGSSKTAPIRLEDVFITGIVAARYNASFIHDGKFAFYRLKPTGCGFENAYSGHQVTPNEMFVIHSQLKSKEIDCATNNNIYLRNMEENDKIHIKRVS